MSIDYELFWEQTFGGNVLNEIFLYAVGRFAAVTNLSYYEYEKILKPLDWFNIRGSIHKDDFIHAFNFITRGRYFHNFKDSLMFVSDTLGGIINNTPYINLTLNNNKRPALQACQYFVSVIPRSLPYLFIVVHQGTSEVIDYIQYDIKYSEYMNTGTYTIIEPDPLVFIDKLERITKKCKILYSYSYNVPGSLWNLIMGNVDSVYIDTAFEKFTNAIIEHAEYEKDDEKAVEYMVSWLQTSKHEKFIIQCSDFFLLWQDFGRYTVEKNSSYIGALAKLIKDISSCQGFVNSYIIDDLPSCYFSLKKHNVYQLEFQYVNEELDVEYIKIAYDKRGFIIRENYIFCIQDICLLVEMIRLTLSRISKCQRKRSNLSVPEGSIITYIDAKFYFIRPGSEDMEELGDICDAVVIFNRIKNFSQCDTLKPITSSRGTIMYAPWNNSNINIPLWFDVLYINTSYAENYKDGTTWPIDEVSIIKSQLMDHIEKEFKFRIYKFIKDTDDFLITKKIDSFLPYLIYLAYGIYVAVIEFNNEKEITISGYNTLGNRVYEKYIVSKNNINEIVSLLNKFNKPIYDDKLPGILLDFYFFEDDEFYSTGSMDIKINIIKSILRKHGFPERK